MDRAMQEFNEAIRLNPNGAEAHAGRGAIYIIKRDTDHAMQDFNEAIRLNPNDAVAYTGRGLAYAANGDTDRAIRDFNEAIRLNPGNANAYTGRGNASAAKGDSDRAMQDYNEAIRLSPNYPGAYFSRGLTRFFLAMFQAAQEDFKKALELDATFPYCAIWLYLARARAGQDGRAELAANAEKLKFVGITEQIVSLFLGKTTPDDLFSAAKSLDAKRQKATLCEAQYYAGQHALLRGNETEARKLFSAAVETCPTNVEIYSGAQAELRRLK
jgi:lipoprotein NlpI